MIDNKRHAVKQSDFDIRKAVRSDADGMLACVESAYRQYIPVIGKKPGPMLDDYAKVVLQHQAFVIEIDNVIAGVLVLIQNDNGVLLDNVAVHTDFQGRGIGSKLVKFAEDEAQRQGYGSLQLYTHELMTENYHAYLKLGYAEIERRLEKGFARIYMQKNFT